jgi:hypothetical protein
LRWEATYRGLSNCASLRARFEQSSLRDEKRFTVKFEELLRTAWQQHLEHSK